MSVGAQRLVGLTTALAAMAAGSLVALEPVVSGLLVGLVLLAFALARLQGAALAWLVVLVAVLPWYDLQAGFKGPSRVPSWVIAGSALLALGAPACWAAANARRIRAVSVGEVLYAGLLFVLFVVSALEQGFLPTLGGPLSNSFFAGATAFLCARRLTAPEDWGPSATVALALLLVVAAVAFVAAPDNRLGSFTGYPILFAALVVALAPPALAYVVPRSWPIGLALVGAGVVALVLSQTRSAWLAAAVMVFALVALLLRYARFGSVALLGALCFVFLALLVSSDALSGIVGDRLARSNVYSDSVTHRQSVYSYTFERFAASPLVGVRGAGLTKVELERRTGIGATDNGFLALAVDLGLLGLAVGLVPPIILARSLWSLWRRTAPSPARLSLALSVLGLLVITMFFDTQYWVQSSLLLFGMVGTLSSSDRSRSSGGRAVQCLRPIP